MAQPEGTPANVRLAQPADEQVQELPSPLADAVMATIHSVGIVQGDPIRLTPRSGLRYFALAPADPAAPVVIYRAATSSESGGWLVTGLMDRDKYDVYREAERAGVLAQPEYQAVI